MVDLRCWSCNKSISDAAWKAVSDKRPTPTVYNLLVVDAEIYYCCGRTGCKDKIEAHLACERYEKSMEGVYSLA